jgi:hypothetical protein
MTLGDAIYMMQWLCGKRSDLENDIKIQLTHAQAHFEKGPTMPWFLLSEVAANVTTVSTQRLTLPDDFLQEYEDGSLFYAPTDGRDEIPLEKGDYDEWMEYFGSTATGEPQAYSLDGRYYRIFPLADEQYPVKMLYYKKDVRCKDLGLDETCQWLTEGSDCIIGWAGNIIAAGIGARDAKATFNEMEQKGRMLLANQNESRKHVNRRYQIGGPAV